MTAPRWALALLRRVSPPGRAEDVLGDLEEAHSSRVQRHGRVIGGFLTSLEVLDVATSLMRDRIRRPRSSPPARSKAEPPGRGRTTWASWLDFKLGFRMLVKYPGLTLVGGLAIAFAIAVGASAFEFVIQVVHPTLPLDEGHRIVGLRLWNTTSNNVEARAFDDFVTWREELRSVEDLGAFRTLERNLIIDGGRAAPTEVAEISASAFQLARVPPLLGRSLLEADERVGAPPVVVIGHDVWQTRFAKAPDVVGRRVRLGSAPTTIIGVMPEGFRFPVSHSLWVPLRLNALDYPRHQGPAIRVFGRLAPGFSLTEAQAELNSIGLRSGADLSDTEDRLVPQVLPYAQSISNISGWESLGFMSINVFLVMLLVLVCGNVALLMFARAATRESEIVVRTALGASRGRIITQLFAEALVLGCVAALAGLATAGFALRWWLGVFRIESGGRLPFWFNDNLAATTVLYAGLLTVLGAGIAGIVPALKVTGRSVEARLRQAAAGGGNRLRLGGVWTAVIITQVAVTVAFPATAFFARREVVRVQTLDVGFQAEEYLSVRLEMEPETPFGASGNMSPEQFRARRRETYRELERRLTGEPGVTGMTFVDRLPRTHHPQRWMEVDGPNPAPDAVVLHRIGAASIDLNYFDVLDTPILSGRGFHSGDVGSDPGVVIVNRSFVGRIMGGRNPIGRRVRDAAPAGKEPGPWYEIVGVVADLGMVNGAPDEDAGLYHPVTPGDATPTHLAIQLGGDPESFAPRLRQVAAAVEPTLRLHAILPLDEVGETLWLEMGFLFWLLVLVSAIALLLSLAGVFAVMAFTVSRRTREIGIRVALGSDRRRIVAAIFSRPLAEVAIGIIAGGGLVAALVRAVIGALSGREVGLVVAYATFMMMVCLLACIVPARRALGVEPAEALREG